MRRVRGIHALRPSAASSAVASANAAVSAAAPSPHRPTCRLQPDAAGMRRVRRLLWEWGDHAAKLQPLHPVRPLHAAAAPPSGHAPPLPGPTIPAAATPAATDCAAAAAALPARTTPTPLAAPFSGAAVPAPARPTSRLQHRPAHLRRVRRLHVLRHCARRQLRKLASRLQSVRRILPLRQPVSTRGAAVSATRAATAAASTFPPALPTTSVAAKWPTPPTRALPSAASATTAAAPPASLPAAAPPPASLACHTISVHPLSARLARAG